LRQDYPVLTAAGAEVVAVAPADQVTVARYWDAERLPFVGLADPDHVAADRYEQQVRLLRFGRLPALFIVDRDGRVRYSQRGRSMRDIPSTGAVLAILDEINRDDRSAERDARH